MRKYPPIWSAAQRKSTKLVSAPIAAFCV